MDAETVNEWHERFADDGRLTLVNLARRDEASRDPDDNVFLSTARAGKARFLITNDRDVLDLPASVRRALAYSIVTPPEFLAKFEGDE